MTYSRTRALGAFAAVLATAVASPVALAQASDTMLAPADQWRFQLTPYVWMTSLDGHVRPFRGAPTAHVDKSFKDTLENLDSAAFLTGTARKGRWVMQGDMSYASISEDAALPLGLAAKTHVRQSSLTLTGGYQWIAQPDMSLDLMAGVRLWKIKASVQVPGLASASSSTSFTDPIVAARWRYQFQPAWSLIVYADAGGFGVGSETTWQALASINYQMSEHWHLSAGYRQLSVDYRDKGRRLDFKMGGPMLGATYRF